MIDPTPEQIEAVAIACVNSHRDKYGMPRIESLDEVPNPGTWRREIRAALVAAAAAGALLVAPALSVSEYRSQSGDADRNSGEDGPEHEWGSHPETVAADTAELVADALHGDQCPDDPEPGEACDCDGEHYRRLASVALVAAAGAAPQEPHHTHTEHVLVTECWPSSCLEGDCDHRDEYGEPEDLSVCPSAPMEVCVDCMVELGLPADSAAWDDAPLAKWPCASVEPAVSRRSSWHFGRSFTGTSVEDGCACVKAPCGLVTHAAAESACCPEHSFVAAKTIRQSHPAGRCPELAATVQVDEAKLADVIWAEQESRVLNGYVIHTRATAATTAGAVTEWLRGGGR